MSIRLTILFLFLLGTARAQTLSYERNLYKKVSMNIKQEKVSDVLNRISKAGDFYFAYNGQLFQQDSLVNLNVKNVPVRDVLDQMFQGKVDYKENSEYIILRYAVNHLTIEPENITSAENLYLISGYVVDTQTGRKIKQASVYEKRLLQSTLTDDNGFFRLRFKGDHQEVILNASKENYRDTALIFLADITVKPESYNDPDKEKGTVFANTLENLGISRFFISSKQRIQNLNLPNFFATTPYQTSLTPGLSSHGMMSPNVINTLSLNILGGYTAGVNGVEVAGLFNLTKGNVKKLQVAGVFNTVGGSVDGIQVAGVLNDVRTDFKGSQVAGVFNHVKQNMTGVQVAGLANVVSHNMRGVQVAGLGNINSRKTDGVQVAGIGNIASRGSRGIQLAGIGNISSRNSTGLQIAGIFNYAEKNNGFQLGLINISGSSDGVSLGLINLVANGYHKLSFSTNELVNANLALKTGNAKLYNILLAGKNYSDTARIETFGLGFGHDFTFNRTFSASAELTAQYLYLGDWHQKNILTKFQTNLQIQLFNGFTIFGGPSYSYYNSDAPTGLVRKNYKQDIVPTKHHNFSGNNKGWYGWSVGITLM